MDNLNESFERAKAREEESMATTEPAPSCIECRVYQDAGLPCRCNTKAEGQKAFISKAGSCF